MVKATAPLSPRQVLGNRQRALSIEEACAGLLAMLGGAGKLPSRRQLQDIAQAIQERQNAALATAEAAAARKAELAALDHELDAAIDVWVGLPLTGARTRKASSYIAALEQRLTSLRQTEAANV
jgi:hypothetical protein